MGGPANEATLGINGVHMQSAWVGSVEVIRRS